MRRLRDAARRRDERSLLLPVGLFLLFCVLAMHGFQASPNQTEMSGVPLTSMSAGQHGADQAPAVPDDSGDHHPGGQVCLAMLSMVVLVAAAVLLALRSRDRVVPVPRAAVLVRTLRGGRPPPAPSLHLLSVLRL
ncbi:DUF6153 family protein [Actinomadura chibensis]|uniref:Uncharacterized protein n=1 Tax=Actinomadura chibensis TaxID=392828 RepID=A0A5D0NIF2_9ACTN|nr:DUF6153 family protein [Actinomadura chibensis]TYB44216.1 hypothetical protein FXF69_25030 [Actinomadura chibensis]